jgi:hypothetical protein
MHFSIFFNYIFNVGFLLCNYSIEITKKSVQHPSEKGYNFFIYFFLSKLGKRKCIERKQSHPIMLASRETSILYI